MVCPGPSSNQKSGEHLLGKSKRRGNDEVVEDTSELEEIFGKDSVEKPKPKVEKVEKPIEISVIDPKKQTTLPSCFLVSRCLTVRSRGYSYCWFGSSQSRKVDVNGKT